MVAENMGVYDDITVIELIIFYRCPETEQQDDTQQPYNDKYFFPQSFRVSIWQYNRFKKSDEEIDE
jgi:hypothetical protein